jgi:ELWxxDGT repeat protein
VKDINLGADSSTLQDLVNFDGVLYFGASDPMHGDELWKSDGTVLGTILVEDINPGVNSSRPSFYSRSYNFVQSNHKLFFWADDGIHGTELWAIESNAVAG